VYWVTPQMPRFTVRREVKSMPITSDDDEAVAALDETFFTNRFGVRLIPFKSYRRNVDMSRLCAHELLIDLLAVLVIDMSKFNVVDEGAIFTCNAVGEKKSKDVLKQVDLDAKTELLLQLYRNDAVFWKREAAVTESAAACSYKLLVRS
jgi:hypothetical protein